MLVSLLTSFSGRSFDDVRGTPDKTVLVPLTNSLYVPGKVVKPETVIVDIGTGYYVEKVCLAPAIFCSSSHRIPLWRLEQKL